MHTLSHIGRIGRISRIGLIFLASVPWQLAAGAQFTLTWTDHATNETGTAIERAPGLDATTGFVVIANVAASPEERTGTGARSYVDSGLPADTAYSYRLRAYNVGGASAYSNTASGTTPPPIPAAPGAPSLDGGPAYTPPPVTVTATFTVQGSALLSANITAASEAPRAP